MAPSAPATPESPGSATRAFRPELQALRALAVTIVLVYHFWPHLLPGGFVGVDVFFVISGFLITSHLVSEIRRTGRVSLPAFWARRARRLLPASLLVLAVTAVASFVLLPASQLQQVFKEIAASALYVQNWVLAADSVDYLAADNVPSPVQHFWSLSTEEQFYIVIPLLMLLALLLLRRTTTRGRDRVVAGTLALVFVASLAYSVYATVTSPGPAYFITPTRAWEFAGGGLLAFVVATRLPATLRGLLSWAGWIGILVSAFVITGDTPFPGWAALAPFVATAAVIVAGRSEARWSADRFLVTEPTVLLGDISYSTYLWHWPALILAPLVAGADLRWPTKMAVIGGVLVLAWLTTRFIEDPVRRMRPLIARPPRVTFAATALAMALVAVPALGGWQVAQQAAAAEVAAAAALAEAEAECFGAGVRVEGHDCAGTVYEQLTPDPSAVIDDRSAVYADGCHTNNASDEVPACIFGDPGGDVEVALVGDSHAVAWLPALDHLGQDRGWRITLLTRAACPFNLAEQIFDTQASIDSCASWKQNVIAFLDGHDPFDLVFSAHFAGAADFVGDSDQGVRDGWSQFLDRGSAIVVLRDPPRAADDTTTCLEQHESDPAACERSVDDALRDDDYIEIAQGVTGVEVIDLTDVFCWDGTCKTAIGGVTVYRDTHHISVTFSITLAPLIGAEVDRLGLP